MSVPAPHFLLHSRTNRTDQSGHWSFSLRSPESPDSLTIEDAEPETHGERLELLAVVRGLEAVPQPSRVTLVTPSSYVNRVLSGGLDEWLSSGCAGNVTAKWSPSKTRIFGGESIEQ